MTELVSKKFRYVAPPLEHLPVAPRRQICTPAMHSNVYTGVQAQDSDTVNVSSVYKSQTSCIVRIDLLCLCKIRIGSVFLHSLLVRRSETIDSDGGRKGRTKIAARLTWRWQEEVASAKNNPATYNEAQWKKVLPNRLRQSNKNVRFRRVYNCFFLFFNCETIKRLGLSGYCLIGRWQWRDA